MGRGGKFAHTTMVILAAVPFAAVRVNGAEPPPLATRMERVNYAIGVEMARRFRSQGIEVSPDLVMKGLRDGLTGKLLIPERELRDTVISFQDELRQKRMVTRMVTGLENRKKEEAFLAANKGKPGVVTLPDGLQYRIVTAGTGRKPKAGDTVTCRYRGTLIDGTEFYRSPGDRPVTLRLSRLIPGWREALTLMPVGSTWQIFIPSSLAYGERGGGGHAIGSNEALILEVELLGIE